MSKEKKPFQTRDIVSISVGHLFHDIYSSFLSPLRPLLIEKFQMTLLLSSFLDVFQRAPNLANPLLGILADRGPGRYFIISGPAITAITMSLLGIAPAYGILAIFLFVMGISGALFHVPSPVLIKKIAGNRIGKGMSFYMMGGELARTLGPLIVTGGVSLWGLEGIWRLIPFGVIASIVLYFRVKNIKISRPAEKAKMAHIKTAFIKYRPFFLTLLGIIFFRAIVKAGLIGFLPTYFFNEKSETLWFSNSSLAVLQLAGAAGTYLSGTISDKIGRKNMLLISATGIPILMWIFILIQGIYTLPILVFLGIFVFSPGPVFLALVQDQKSEHPAFLNGIYMTLTFVSDSVAIVMVGWLGDLISLQTTYMITGSAAILGIPFILQLSTNKPAK